MRAIKGIQIEDIVFIDAETTRLHENLEPNTPTFDAWEYKMKRSLEEAGEDIFENYIDKSALYPEFSRLVCITVGRVRDGKVTLTTYSDSDEQKMIRMFMDDLDAVVKHSPKTQICGHSVKNFDIPFIFKRAIVNGVAPNLLMDVAGLKPWEVTAIDTKELWKGSGYYNTSLIMLCLALGVESPKGDITGAEVGNVYFKEGEKGVERIVKYCERDVFALINCFRKMRFEEVFDDFEVRVPVERKPLRLIERIAENGEISPEDENLIYELSVQLDYKEKEAFIKNLNGALKLKGGKLDEIIELTILKGNYTG